MDGEDWLSWGFAPLQREVTRVHLSRGIQPRYVPLTGFLNLLAIYSSRYPEALFHATGAHGVLPAEFSPRNTGAPLVEEDAWLLGVSFSSQTTGAGRSAKIVWLYMSEDMCRHTNTPCSAAYAAFESVHCLLWFYPPQVVVTLMGCCGLSGYITNQHRLQEPLLSCTSTSGASTRGLYFRA